VGIQQDFFEAVLSESGAYCIARLGGNGPPKHDKYRSIAAMCAALESAPVNKENFYFAISTFKDWDAKHFRAQTNAQETRCLILDVDVKQKEGYCHTQEEALPLIDTLCEAVGFPKPIIVNSGYGYHLYWPFGEAVSSDEWKTLAKAFHAAVGMFAPPLVADASRVSDSASILRIPGTYNLKNGKAVEVTLEQWHDGWLSLEEVREKLNRFIPKESAKKVDLEVAREYEPAPLAAAAKNCNWLGTYMRNMATAEEPEWYAVLGMAPFIVHTKADGTQINGTDVAHLLSKGHPDYDHDATVLKFHQAKTKQTGPTTCAKFQSLNPKPCEGCPFKGAVKTPLQAARLERPATKTVTVETKIITDEGTTEEATVDIPIPPKPYFRGESGGVYVRLKNEEGEDFIHKIYDYDLYPVRRYRSEVDEEEKVECHLWLPRDGMRRFKMPTELLADQKKLASYLASRGAVPESGGAKLMAKYLTDYTRDIQTKVGAEVEFTRYGWRNIARPDCIFVVGNGYYDAKGLLHPASFPSYLRDAAPAAAAVGDLAKWTKAFNVYKHIPNSEVFQFTALLGFAAPLLALTEYSGVLYNMVGASGAGKSTAMKVMTSVWGQPNENHVRVNDNMIPVHNFIGYLNSIPVAFDEVTNMTPAAASDFALNFTSGRGKMRADRNGHNKANETSWDTIVVCTSNGSMYDKFAAARKGYSAEAMRLFEVNIDPAAKAENMKYKSRVDEAMNVLHDNYGVAGREYIPYIIRNREKIRKAIDAKVQWVLEQSGATSSERFWAVLLACMSVGATIAKSKGLHDYDADHLLRWAMGQVSKARESVAQATSDPVATLGEFFNANIGSTIRIKDGQPDLTLQSGVIREVKARLEYEGDQPITGYVSMKALGDYCKESNIDCSWLISELLRMDVIKRNITKRLATGTKLHNPVVNCIRIDLTNQKLANVG
jgi:hypothetical protein